MKAHIGFVLATTSSLAILMGMAHADTTATADSADAAPGLDEIVVNARRVDERLQDVPITVTAVSTQTLADMHIDQGTDLIKVVPTLSVQQGAQGPNANYAIRGIRDGVVTYFNEVPANTVAVDDQIWDLASIQALAGPAGTLFGENATGGVILFVPQKPTKNFEGYIDASYGDYNYQQINAVVNLPVNDELQFRFGGRFVKHDPFVENTLNTGLESEDRQAFRGSMLFEPTSNISDYLVVDYNHRNERSLALISSYMLPGGLQAAFYGPTLLLAEQAQQDALGIRKVASPFPSVDKSDNDGISNVFSASFAHDLTLKYILGFRHSASDELSSKSGYTVPIEVGQNSTFDATQWTNEVQLLGANFNQRLHWTLGYYNKIASTPALSNYELFGLPGEPFSQLTNIVHDDVYKDKTQAGYAQATYAITDKMNLTAGGRYTKDTATLSGSSTQPEFFFSGPEVCGLTPGASGVDLANCTQDQSQSTHAVTYTVSLDYHLTQGVLLYATNRKGYNAGGFNASVPTSPPPGAPQATYNPEFVTDYEVGVKTEGSVAGAPFRANLSVYLANYTQIQRESFGVTPTGTYDGIANGPKARINGIQLESEFRPFHDFTLMLNYGYLHTEYVEGSPGFPVGNVFGQAPEHTLNVSGTYRHDLPVGGNVLATASYAYQSQISFMDDNIGLLHSFQDGYGVGNARVGWESILHSTVDVSLFVKNFTNVAYAVEKQDESALLGFTGTVYNDPRTYGVEMHYRF